MAKKAPKKAVKKKAAKKKAPQKQPPAKAPAPRAVVDNTALLDDASLTLTVELGRTRETIETALEFGDQSLVELDRMVGDPVDIMVNGMLFGRGEVVTVDENFGVRVTEVVQPV